MQISLPLRLSTTGIVGLAALSATHWMRENISEPAPVLAFALGVMPNLAAAFAMPLVLASFAPRTSGIPVTVRSRRTYLWILLFTAFGLFGWELVQTRSERFVFDAYDIVATGLGSFLAYLAFGWHASGFEVSSRSAQTFGRKAVTTQGTHPMSSLRAVVPSIPLAAFAFAFAAAHVAFEYFSGGVKTHHFLARADLPGFSNWLGLFVLPMLGVVLAVRAKAAQGGQASSILPPALAVTMFGSLAYGAALAASFHFGLEQVSLVLFIGLFLLSIARPVYRAEYIFGFVVGMTVTFGSVIPLAFALFFATISFALRHTAVFVLSAMRKPPR